MARIFEAGFESHGVEVFNTVSGATRYSTSGLDMDGSYCMECSAGGDYAIKTLASSYAGLYFALRYRPNSDSSVTSIMQLRDSSGTVVASIQKNASGYIEARNGTYNGTLLATGTKGLSTGHTYVIEVHYVPLNSGGTVTVKIDGFTDINYSSGDTTAGLENVQGFLFGAPSGANYGYGYYDDIIVDDDKWIGKTYIQGLTISAAGTTTQWDPSTGSNYACIDEVPYSDTDYISTNVTDEIDTYALSNLTGTIDSIKALTLTGRAAYDGSPTPTHIQLGVRSGGSDYFATDFSPPSSFGFLGQRILEADPATAAAWTESGINAVECGVKATA